MKFLKVKSTSGRLSIVNLSQVMYFYEKSKTETIICLSSESEFTIVDIPIEEFTKILDMAAASTNHFVWDITQTF